MADTSRTALVSLQHDVGNLHSKRAMRRRTRLHRNAPPRQSMAEPMISVEQSLTKVLYRR
jgi:hypothetical protein